MTLEQKVIYKEKHEYTWSPDRYTFRSGPATKPTTYTRVFPFELSFYLLSDISEYSVGSLVNFNESEYPIFHTGTQVRDWLRENVGTFNQDWKAMNLRNGNKKRNFNGKVIVKFKRYLFKRKEDALLFKLAFG